jgi:hypothetical protein
MRKKRTLAALTAIIGAAVSVSVIALNTAGSPATVASGGDYSITLSSTNGAYAGESTFTATTTEGNEISFTGTNLSVSDGNCAKIGGPGSLYNVDSISNITSFTAVFTGSYVFASYWWSNDDTSVARSMKITSGTEVTLSDSPSYLKIFTDDEWYPATLTSLTINYDCGVSSETPDDAGTYYTDGLEFTWDSSTSSFTISGASRSATEAYIPDTYTDSSGNTGPITKIGDSAFSGTSVRHVRLPETVTSIGSYAFNQASLRSIDLSHVTSLGKNAFEYCTRLTSVTFSEELTSIPGGCFFESGLTIVRLPDSVVTLGSGAFQSCEDLTTVIFGDKIEKLDSGVFYGCTAIKTVVIGKSLNNINSGCFSGAKVLVSGNIVYYHGKPSDVGTGSGDTGWGTSYDNVEVFCSGTASVYYYDESITTATDSDGNHYWHYDDSDLPVANS